jgi:hypothetical protein
MHGATIKIRNFPVWANAFLSLFANFFVRCQKNMLSKGKFHENKRAEKHTFHTDLIQLMSATFTLSFQRVWNSVSLSFRFSCWKFLNLVNIEADSVMLFLHECIKLHLSLFHEIIKYGFDNKEPVRKFLVQIRGGRNLQLHWMCKHKYYKKKENVTSITCYVHVHICMYQALDIWILQQWQLSS